MAHAALWRFHRRRNGAGPGADHLRIFGYAVGDVEAGGGRQKLTPGQIARELQRLVTSAADAESVGTTASSTATSVLLADDHQILLQGLHVLIDGEPDMRVVGSADNGADAIRQAFRLVPQVVVMDVCMPGLDGAEATREILASFPATHVVALSSLAQRSMVDRMLHAGARGYLTKNRAFGELVTAIRSVRQGKQYFSSDVAQ